MISVKKGALWLLPLLLGSSMAVHAEELTVKRIEDMVKRIQQKRISKMEFDYQKIKSPFVVVKKEENTTVLAAPEADVDFSLSGVMGDSAYINGRWVKKGEKIEGYRVDSVSEKHVLLKKADREIELFLEKQKQKILDFK